MSILRVALLQMVSVRDWQRNLQIAESLVLESLQSKPDLIVLPEFFIQISDESIENRFAIAEDLGNGIIQDYIAALARKHSVYILAGTILIKSDQDSKYYNTAILFSPTGEIVTAYNKIHLFKYEDGVESYDEGDFFISGDSISTFSISDWSFGLGICYDLRFPELFRGFGFVDAILLPSAFTSVTGRAHWEVLSRARAIENQCYFLAVNQGGIHETGRHTYGNSMAIDPWGNVITRCGEGNHVLHVTLSKNDIQSVRAKLPSLLHKKL